ncbi:MAG: divalent-cation tolerance protein CutA [Proteobacteria bacterium]|nr:divalent-cation tolerance protein CutA [Pseudomonadota bacterium]
MTACIVYVTASNDEEAKMIGQTLVAERLVACANILPGMTAIYRWDGAVQQDSEVSLLLKTTDAHLEAVTVRVRSLHSHDCPCVVSWPITGGSVDFIHWIESETSS